MEDIYSYIVNNIAKNNINKETGIEILKYLKANDKINDDIAVIGMSVRLPKSHTTNEFWELIKSGKDYIEKFPSERKFDIEDYIKFCIRTNKRYTDHENINFLLGGYLEEISMFDYDFFGFTPRQAAYMDPNHRLMLEIVYHAIEDAGYGGNKLLGSNTGVFIGFAAHLVSTYANMINEVEPDSVQVSLTGNLPSILPSRISHILDLKGPTMIIDTSCSSSLVAIHQACQALHNRECDFAIAGGVKTNMLPIENKNHLIGIESSDGKGKAFDDSSDGTAVGEGVGAILLKPLKKAIEDRDNIHAIIKGSAINQDGRTPSITSPNPQSQTDVILNAWKNAGVDPESISYIETHGTGTKIGDVIEIEAIKRAFEKHTKKQQFCAIGTVKNNIGHLFEGSGIISFIKSVLILKNKELPPLANFKTPNEKIDFIDSPVYINKKSKLWQDEKNPMRCGVSAFGFSGTNCHMVLEETFQKESKNEKEEMMPLIFVLSAHSKEQLMLYLDKYKAYLNRVPDYNIKNICYTSCVGKGHYEYRLAIISLNKVDLLQKINSISKNTMQLPEQNIYYGKNNRITRDEIYETQELIQKNTSQDLMQQNKDTSITTDINALKNMCVSYVKGENVCWEKLYKGMDVRKVSLPLYPYNKKKCWINIPKILNDPNNIDDGRLYYYTYWIKEKRPERLRKYSHKTVILIKDESELGISIAKLLRDEGKDVIEIMIGDVYKKIAPNHYSVKSKKDFLELFKDKEIKEVEQIIHMSSVDDCEGLPKNINELEKTQNKGVISLFHLISAIISFGIKSDIELVLVSKNTDMINDKKETINPQNAMVFGLGRILEKEYNTLKCRYIDIDRDTSVQSIYDEIICDTGNHPIGYRKGIRYAQVFDSLDEIDSIGTNNIEIKSNGVYIITGGLGGIGLEIAKYLSQKGNVNIVLVQRSKLPPRVEWQKILEDDIDEKLIYKLKSILEIEETGSNVLCVSIDISNEQQVTDLVKNLKSKHKSINGIIHSAGIAGNSLIRKSDEETFKKVLVSKVRGTYLLDSATKDENLDFFVLFSSVATLFGSPGQGNYVAANAFLDSYANYRNSLGKKTLTINWVAWKEIGMAVDCSVNVDMAFKAIETKTAISAFDTVLNKNISRVLVGELNYSGGLAYTIDKSYIKLADRLKQRLKNKNNQPHVSNIFRFDINEKKKIVKVKLSGREDDNFTDTEKIIGQIWSEALGYDELNINDNFYTIGGDSLAAMEIVNRISKNLNVKLNIAEIFSCLTISELSEYIENKYLNNSQDDFNESVN